MPYPAPRIVLGARYNEQELLSLFSLAWMPLIIKIAKNNIGRLDFPLSKRFILAEEANILSNMSRY
jgi:hypothetical protein